MPAGVSWVKYCTFTAVALLSMMAGSQFIHTNYQPLRDLPIYLEAERQHRRKLQEHHDTNHESVPKKSVTTHS